MVKETGLATLQWGSGIDDQTTKGVKGFCLARFWELVAGPAPRGWGVVSVASGAGLGGRGKRLALQQWRIRWFSLVKGRGR